MRRAIAEQIQAVSSAAYGIADACTAAMLRLAEASGYTVACRRGCGACCDCFVVATFAESLPIAIWLSGGEQKRRRDAFRRHLRQRLAAMGPEAAALEEILPPETPGCRRGNWL